MAAISQEQLNEAVAETRGVLEHLLYQEITGLVKAAIDGEEPGSDEGGGADDAPPAAEGSAETPSTSDASPGEAPGEASGQDMGGAPGADPAAGGDGSAPSMDQLVQEYAQLPPEELKMHLMAAQAAYEQVAGGAGGDAGAGAPGAPGGAPGAAAPPPGPDAGGGAPPSPGDEMSPAMKAEIKAQFDALKKSFDAQLQRAMADLRKPTPKVSQRAVTGQNATERLPGANRAPAPQKRLSKGELTNRLKELTADPQKLTKAERERINQFYDGGQRDYSLIKNIEGLKSLFQ